MSAILIMVAVRMGDWREFIVMPRYSHGRTGTLLSTFILTVVFDLTVAVQVGILWASLLLIRRMAQVTVIARASDAGNHEIPGLAIYAARGVLFFGAADTVEVLTRNQEAGLRVVILDLDYVLYMDSTATHALEMADLTLSARGVTLLVCGAHQQPALLIRQSGLQDLLNHHRLLPERAAAIARAQQILAAP
jgi:SulP family sulfate permease